MISVMEGCAALGAVAGRKEFGPATFAKREETFLGSDRHGATFRVERH